MPGTRGHPHRLGLPSSTLARSCGNKRQRPAGREGPEALQQRTSAAAAGTAARERGWSQLPAALCSQNDRVKKKRGEKKYKYSKATSGARCRVSLPSNVPFLRFCCSGRQPVERERAGGSSGSRTGESPRAAAEQEPGEPWAWLQGRRFTALGAQRDPAAGDPGHPARPPPGCCPALAAAAAEKPRSVFAQCRTRQCSLMREHYNQLVMLNF